MARKGREHDSRFNSDVESVYKNVPEGDKPKRQEKPKKKRHWVRSLVIAVVALVLLRAGCSLVHGSGSSSSKKELIWPTSGLATMLPTPDSTRGEVTSNRSDYFRAEAYGFDQSGYHTYMQSCKDAGFTVDPKEGDSYYRAYNSDGYRLELNYWDFDDPETGIVLKTPVPNDPITWPTSGLGASIPAPTSLTGEITSDSSTRFDATITNTTPDDYSTYVTACMNAGFTVDYDRDGESFDGSNTSGVKIDVDYIGYHTMTITAQQDSSATDTASTEEDTSVQENTSTSANVEQGATEAARAEESTTNGATANTGGVTPSFKEAMDSYEVFFDKYVQFMQKYKDDGYPASMLADYSSLMQQYADFTQKIDSIDEGTLSAADDAYYIEVTSRISQKLLTVSS